MTPKERAKKPLEPSDLEDLASAEILETAQSLHAEPPERVPSELLQRVSTMSAQLVTAVAGEEAAPVTGRDDLLDCARILKRRRFERERAAVQREIDDLQRLGSDREGKRLDLLLNQKRTLAQRVEELTWLTGEDG